MKKLVIIFLLQCSLACASGQSLKKYPIAESGCSAYFLCDPGNFETTYSQDSSKMYSGECIDESVSYGLICVKLSEDIPDMSAAEEMLISYMDFLKMTFNITSGVGYGKGHKLKDNENTRGVVDYWEDAEKNNWKVKGWTDGKFLAVLFAHSKKALPEAKVNLFLEGIVFPKK